MTCLGSLVLASCLAIRVILGEFEDRMSVLKLVFGLNVVVFFKNALLVVGFVWIRLPQLDIGPRSWGRKCLRLGLILLVHVVKVYHGRWSDIIEITCSTAESNVRVYAVFPRSLVRAQCCFKDKGVRLRSEGETAWRRHLSATCFRREKGRVFESVAVVRHGECLDSGLGLLLIKLSGRQWISKYSLLHRCMLLCLLEQLLVQRVISSSGSIQWFVLAGARYLAECATGVRMTSHVLSRHDVRLRLRGWHEEQVFATHHFTWTIVDSCRAYDDTCCRVWTLCHAAVMLLWDSSRSRIAPRKATSTSAATTLRHSPIHIEMLMKQMLRLVDMIALSTSGGSIV